MITSVSAYIHDTSRNKVSKANYTKMLDINLKSSILHRELKQHSLVLGYLALRGANQNHSLRANHQNMTPFTP